MTEWYIGTIGFSYQDWVGPFYPIGSSQHEYLHFYSKYFNSVEIDTTFHAPPRQSTIQSWLENSPRDFKFCLKTPRRITHELRLINAENLMDDFLEAFKSLISKMGPVLIQLPPSFDQSNFAILQSFLESLPKTNRFAIEFRHASWYNNETIDLLSNFEICMVSIDYPKLPKELIKTSGFHYIRWIGINNLYHHHSHERVGKSGQLKWWLELIRSASSEINEIYGYFNNDYAGFGAGTSLRFKQIAGLKNNSDEIFYQGRFLS